MYSRSIVDRIEGLEAAWLDEYIEDFNYVVKIPSQYKELKEALARSIKFAKYSSRKQFNGNEIAFTKEGGGKSIFVTFMHKKIRENNTYNIVYTYFTADFALAPDMYVMNKGLSVLGGIWEDNKDVIKRVPRSLTTKDIDSLFSFMHLMTTKALYVALGVDPAKLPLPDI